MGRRREGRSGSMDKAREQARRAARGAERAASRARRSSSERKSTKSRKLAKSQKDKKLAGVASGIADYLGIEPTLVRIAFVIGAIFGSGATIPLYVILALVLPRANDGEPTSSERRRARRRRGEVDDDDDPVIAVFRDDD